MSHGSPYRGAPRAQGSAVGTAFTSVAAATGTARLVTGSRRSRSAAPCRAGVAASCITAARNSASSRTCVGASGVAASRRPCVAAARIAITPGTSARATPSVTATACVIAASVIAASVAEMEKPPQPQKGRSPCTSNKSSKDQIWIVHGSPDPEKPASPTLSCFEVSEGRATSQPPKHKHHGDGANGKMLFKSSSLNFSCAPTK